MYEVTDLDKARRVVRHELINRMHLIRSSSSMLLSSVTESHGSDESRSNDAMAIRRYAETADECADWLRYNTEPDAPIQSDRYGQVYSLLSDRGLIR